MRSVRSRRAVVEAFLDLISEGEVQPTAQTVSERSGVSPSTIFRLFEDLEALHAEALAVQAERVSDLIAEIPPTGPIEDRVHQLVLARGRLYEAVAPLLRFQSRSVATSAGARSNQRTVNVFLRAQVSRLFADELSGDSARALDVVDALTSWELWDRLRSIQGLSIRQARAAIEHTILSTLSAPR